MSLPIDKAVTFALPEQAIPTSWYNVTADLPFTLPPPIHPATESPSRNETWSRFFRPR